MPFVLLIAMIVVLFAGVSAQDEGCAVAPSDIEVAISETQMAALRVVGGALIIDDVSAADMEGEPPLVPFQRVHVTPDPDGSCDEGSRYGALVQNADPEHYVPLTVNEVPMWLSGTAFVWAGEDSVRVFVLDGRVIIGIAYLPEGTEADVQMLDGSQVSAARPYDPTTLIDLPLSGGFGSPFETVELAAPPPAEDIEGLILQQFAPDGIAPGRYDVSVIRFTEIKPDTLGSGYCFSRGEDLTTLTVTSAQDLLERWGDSLQVWLATSFTFKNEHVDDFSGCSVTHYATWVAPE